MLRVIVYRTFPLRAAAEALNLSRQQTVSLVRNGFEGSFLTPGQKAVYLTQVAAASSHAEKVQR